jgi:hypothetical protein
LGASSNNNGGGRAKTVLARGAIETEYIVEEKKITR